MGYIANFRVNTGGAIMSDARYGAYSSLHTQILESGTHTRNTTRMTNEQTHKPSDAHETHTNLRR